jgi:hypothetical protein
MDFALLSVPMIVVWKAKMTRGAKIRLGFALNIDVVSVIGAVMWQAVQKKLTTDDVLCTIITLPRKP